MQIIEVYFDGLCQPRNPGGVACYAYVVKKGGQNIQTDYGVAGEPFSKDSTNNVAEYTALLKALQWLDSNGYHGASIEVRGDSRLIVNQVNGEFKVRTKRLVPLYLAVLELIKKFKLNIKWIPREENAEADRLSNVAYNKFLQQNPRYLKEIAKK